MWTHFDQPIEKDEIRVRTTKVLPYNKPGRKLPNKYPNLEAIGIQTIFEFHKLKEDLYKP